MEEMAVTTTAEGWKKAYQDKLDAILNVAEATPSGLQIVDECLALAKLLVDKNAAYGDSAINPIRLFSKASAEEQILVRLDDKVSRLARGSEAGEDVFLDIMGYIILLRVARRQTEEPKP